MVNICKNCRYWLYKKIDKDHVCTNSDSPFLSKWMPEGDNCKKFEGKEVEEEPYYVKHINGDG